VAADGEWLAIVWALVAVAVEDVSGRAEKRENFEAMSYVKSFYVEVSGVWILQQQCAEDTAQCH
jgi:hypothetical protein